MKNTQTFIKRLVRLIGKSNYVTDEAIYGCRLFLCAPFVRAYFNSEKPLSDYIWLHVTNKPAKGFKAISVRKIGCFCYYKNLDNRWRFIYSKCSQWICETFPISREPRILYFKIVRSRKLQTK